MTRNVPDCGAARTACGCPRHAAIGSAEKSARCEAKRCRYYQGLRISWRGAQSRVLEERWQTAGGFKPRSSAVRGTQRAADVIARKAGPGGNHVLVDAVFDDLKISNVFDCALCAFKNLVPTLPGVSASPDCGLEPSNPKVGAAEQNEIGIVMTEARCIEIGFIERTLIWTKRSPRPVGFAPVQAFLGH